MNHSTPFVSVIIPVFNEYEYLEKTISSIINQDYQSNLYEIIIVDGLSDDGTRDIIRKFIEIDSRIKLIDNPRRIVPIALNKAISIAKGEIIIRIDGHCEVAINFISENIKILNEYPDIVSAGGPIAHSSKTDIGRSIALAMSHPLGVGNAFHRYNEYEGYVEGAQFPSFRSEIFKDIGLFDEDFIRNQDDEFNYRIRLAGKHIYVSPKIRFKYYVRENFESLFKQYLQYGFWRIPFLIKHRKPSGFRQLVPSLFFSLCTICFIVGFLTKSLPVMVILPSIYIVTLLSIAIKYIFSENFSTAISFPLAIFIMHFGYAAGFFYGIIKLNSWKELKSMSKISR